jgi:hypothetical protein
MINRQLPYHMCEPRRYLNISDTLCIWNYYRMTRMNKDHTSILINAYLIIIIIKISNDPIISMMQTV